MMSDRNTIWIATQNFRFAEYPDGQVKLQQLWMANTLEPRWELMVPVRVDENGNEIKGKPGK